MRDSWKARDLRKLQEHKSEYINIYNIHGKKKNMQVWIYIAHAASGRLQPKSALKKPYFFMFYLFLKHDSTSYIYK